jgi:hypothetical protein
LAGNRRYWKGSREKERGIPVLWHREHITWNQKVKWNYLSCPILELTRLTLRSGHHLTLWYHSFSETLFTDDELEVYGLLKRLKNLWYMIADIKNPHNKKIIGLSGAFSG